MVAAVIDRRQFFGAAAAVAVGFECFECAAQDQQDKKSLRQRTSFAVNIEMWFRKLPFLQRIEAAAKLGFPAIEFWPWRNKDLDAIAQKTKELGLDVAQFTAWGFVPGLNNPKNHDRFVKEIEASCAAAKKLGAKKMTVVGGNDQKGMTQVEMHGHI
ncbi:MAG: TIM barrel protein, partial [Planctomycetota bacterium]|nr:TIM barrel protein [Planctomycetota bacterium]